MYLSLSRSQSEEQQMRRKREKENKLSTDCLSNKKRKKSNDAFIYKAFFSSISFALRRFSFYLEKTTLME